MRRICDVCGKSLELRKEWLYICLEDEENNVAFYDYELVKPLEFKQNWEKIDQEKWIRVFGGICCTENGSSKWINITLAGVLSAHAQASPLFNIQSDERWIAIGIDAQLWKKLRSVPMKD